MINNNLNYLTENSLQKDIKNNTQVNEENSNINKSCNQLRNR